MALYLIERQFAEMLEMSPEGIETLQAINAEMDVHWLFSFLSADKRKTYCLYQAASPEALMEAARRAGIPADHIVEVDQITPPPG